MAKPETSNATRWLDMKIRFMDLVQLVLLLTVIIAGWYKFDYRVQNLEKGQAEQTEQVVKLTGTLASLDTTLSKLNQTLVYFPPHVHVDDEIVFPDGHRETSEGMALPPRTKRRYP